MAGARAERLQLFMFMLTIILGSNDYRRENFTPHIHIKMLFITDIRTRIECPQIVRLLPFIRG